MKRMLSNFTQAINSNCLFLGIFEKVEDFFNAISDSLVKILGHTA